MWKFIVLAAIPLLPALFFIIRRRVGHRREDGGQKHRRGGGHRHGSWVSIDYFAYASHIRHWNPVFKVVLSLVTIVLCIVLNNVYVSLAVVFAMAFLVVEMGGLALRSYLSVLTIPLAFLLISVLAIVVDVSQSPIGPYCVSIGFTWLYTTPAMLKGGLALALKVVAAISALQLMILTTPSSEIISVLRRARVPDLLVDLMNLIYRFIFILLEVSGRMSNAAESRLGYRGFRTSCRTFGSLAGNLLILSLKRAGAYYDAMESRCYDGVLRVLEEEKKLDLRLVLSGSAFMLYLLVLWGLTT